MENEALLKSLPPPLVALEYYKAGDLYFFDALQTTGTDPKRRPACACEPALVNQAMTTLHDALALRSRGSLCQRLCSARSRTATIPCFL